MATETEQRIAEIRQTLRAARLKEIADPLEGLLDYIASVPSQVEAAVKAEREACDSLMPMPQPGVPHDTDYGRAWMAAVLHYRAAIRSRGETSL